MKWFIRARVLLRLGFTPLIAAWLALCTTSVIGQHMSKLHDVLQPSMSDRDVQRAYGAERGKTVEA